MGIKILALFQSGLTQGDELSMTLFNLTLEFNLVRKLQDGELAATLNGAILGYVDLEFRLIGRQQVCG